MSDSSPRVFVLDTNVVRNDFHCRGRHLSELIARASSAGWRAAVPRVVVEEMNAHFRRDAEGLSESLKSMQRMESRLSGRCATVSYDISGINLSYDFGANFQRAGGYILPIPTVDHLQVVRRAAAHRRPFVGGGPGYRDTMIWETVVEAARSGSRVILVSADRGFAGKESELRSELQEEAFGLDVSLTTSLHWAIKQLSDKQVERTEEVETSDHAQAGKSAHGPDISLILGKLRLEPGNDIGKPLVGILREAAVGTPLDEKETLMSSSRNADQRIEEIGRIYLREVVSVLRLSGGEISLGIKTLAITTVSYTQGPQPGTDSCRDLDEGVLNDDGVLRVKDTVVLSIVFDVVVREETGEVASAGLSSVRPMIGPTTSYTVRD